MRLRSEIICLEFPIRLKSIVFSLFYRINVDPDKSGLGDPLYLFGPHVNRIKSNANMRSYSMGSDSKKVNYGL